MVIAGPSGVGKGTLIAALRRRCPELVYSVSVTTRRPRPGEVEGVAYRFVSDQQFDDLATTGGLLEWTRYAGTRYGTPRQPVADALAAGKTVLLEIDLEGARQVRHNFPEAEQVFIAPPSFDELARRLHDRGADTPAQMATRLARARAEVAAEGEFNDVVVNDDMDRAVDELVNLLGPGNVQ